MSDRGHQNSFRLTSDRDYRRGVILGLTLAEVMLLLIFLLLMAAGILLARSQEKADLATKRVAAVEHDLAPLLNALKQNGYALANADELAAVIRRAHQADMLDSELSAVRSIAAQVTQESAKRQKELEAARMARSAVQQELSKTKQELSEVRETVATAQRDSAAQQDALEAARMVQERMVRALSDAKKELATRQAGNDTEKLINYDAMLKILNAVPGGAGSHPDQTLSNMVGQNRQAAAELARVKGNGGSGLPYCWTTEGGQPVYMLRFELLDTGFRALELPERPRSGDPAWGLLSNLPRNSIVQENDLMQDLSRISDDSKRKNCRYAVEVVDRTSPTNKKDYRHLNYVLDLIFHRRELNP